MIVRRFALGVLLLTAAQVSGEWRRVPVDGGQLTCLERSPAPPYTLFACTQSAVYSSADDGASWRLVRAFDQRNDGAVFGLAVAPEGTRVFVVAGYSFWASRDGGATLQRVTREHGGYGTVVEVSRANPDFVYVGDWRSTDGGLTWTWMKPPFVITRSRDLHPTEPNTLLDVRANELQRSTDGGSTWTTLFSEPAGSYVTCAAYDPVNPQHILAGTRYGLVESLDGGSTWKGRFDAVPYTPNQSNIIDAIVFDAQRPGRVLVTLRVPVLSRSLSSSTLHESTNGGATFAQILKRIDPLRFITTSPASERIVNVGGDQSARTSDGGVTWNDALHGIHDISYIRRFVVDPHDPDHIVAIGPEARLHTFDAGETWSRRSDDPCDAWLAFDPDRAGHALCGPEYCGFCYHETNDGGAKWTERQLGGGAGGTPIGISDALILPGSRTTLFGASFVVRSRDYGKTVQSMEWFQTRPFAGAHFKATASAIFAWNSLALARSSDNGANWSDLAYPQRDLRPSFFAVSPHAQSWLVGTIWHSFVTTSAGASWREISEPYSWCTAAAFTDDGRGLVACDRSDTGFQFGEGAVLRSDATLESWTAIHQASYRSVARGDTVLAMATAGERVFVSLQFGGLLVYEPPGPRRRSVRH